MAIFCCFAFRRNVFHMYGVGRATRQKSRMCACKALFSHGQVLLHSQRRDAAMGVTGENAALRRFAVFTQATLNHLCPAPLCGAGHEEREIPAGLLRLRVSRFAIDRILSKRSLSIWNVKGVLFVGISFPLFFQSPFHALYRLCRAGDKNKNARQIRFCRAIRFLNLPALPVKALKKRKAPHVFRALTLAAHPSKRQTETAVCISTRLATAQ